MTSNKTLSAAEILEVFEKLGISEENVTDYRVDESNYYNSHEFLGITVDVPTVVSNIAVC